MVENQRMSGSLFPVTLLAECSWYTITYVTKVGIHSSLS